MKKRQLQGIYFCLIKDMNLLEYNYELMIVIAIDLEDYMGQYGIVWYSGMVEVRESKPRHQKYYKYTIILSNI